MEQYIPKSALVVEIEKLIDEIYAGRPFDSLSSEQQTALWYVKSIMSSVNTLEVKDVDLDKELNKLDSTLYDMDGVAIDDNTNSSETRYITVEDVKDIAKHFFNLGIASK